MNKFECGMSLTLFRGRDRHGIPRTVPVFTGGDFLLDDGNAATLVRCDGAILHIPELEMLPIHQPVRQEIPAAVQAVLETSPLADCLALYWSESAIGTEAQLEVIGVCRNEQAPPDLPWRGLRELPTLPTLSAVDGVLEIVMVC
jgi:hypothetical protein